MNATLPPLPLPFPSNLIDQEGRGLRVQALPVFGSTAARPTPPPAPLPTLGNISLSPFAALAPAQNDPAPEEKPPDFTDSDLVEALLPLVGGAASGISFHDDASFEAVLRATFRRALAEHSSGPFEDPDLAHRILWRAQALFTSRSYEEVLADKTRRFQVEEVYLLDADRLSLVSYASTDPVRHAKPRRVGSYARQLASRVKDDSGAILLGFELGENRRTFIRPGRFCCLVAVVRGEINDLLKADLDFALRRIESRYHEPFVQGLPLLKELQPLLEECLLIHAPLAPAAS